MKAIGQSASIKDFKDFNYIYIDKTEQIYSLLGQRRVFFSRPRRFGKSLVSYISHLNLLNYRL